MSTATLYTLLILAVAVERLAELVVNKRNVAWSMARGGIERGQGHYPVMVVLHTGFLLGCLAEIWFLERPFIPALAASMVLLAILAQILRWWCITSLGPRWSTRVVIVPGLPRITKGPYRWLAHPNYVAVVVEGIALPLIHSAWYTAVIFTVANALLLRVRIQVENAALREMEQMHRTAEEG